MLFLERWLAANQECRGELPPRVKVLRPIPTRRVIIREPKLKLVGKKHSRKDVEGRYTPDDIALMRKRQGDRCVYCNWRLKGKGHIDHNIPVTRGGTNWPHNLQLLCADCNLDKRTRTGEEYIIILKRRNWISKNF